MCSVSIEGRSSCKLATYQHSYTMSLSCSLSAMPRRLDVTNGHGCHQPFRSAHLQHNGKCHNVFDAGSTSDVCPSVE